MERWLPGGGFLEEAAGLALISGSHDPGTYIGMLKGHPNTKHNRRDSSQDSFKEMFLVLYLNLKT